MKQTYFFILGIFLILATTVGCASASKIKDEQSLASVKKVAVIGFKATLPTSAKLGLDLSSGKTEASSGGSLLTENSKDTDQILSDFHKALQKHRGWSMLPLESMKSHPAYISAYKHTMEGWQNKMPPGQGVQVFLSQGVMDTDAPRLLGMEGRDQLMTALGVDAIAILSVHVHLEGMTVMGLGNRMPQSRPHLQVFRKGVEKPIWFETYAGEVSKESVGKTGFIDEKKLARLAFSSAQSAYSKMGSETQ